MKTQDLIVAMMRYDQGDAKRIQHFIKVYEFARTIGIMENLDEKTQFILESAAIVHDIGIHISEQKYGNCGGKYQEIEGPAEAEKLLEELEYPADVRERVCYLVGHHHTYHDIDGVDYQILVEADFLVNLFEDETSEAGREAAYENIFRTESGKKLFRYLYLPEGR